jgi:hypothetical protein
MGKDPLGWMITVQLPDRSSPQAYNVANPRRASGDRRGQASAAGSQRHYRQGQVRALERVYQSLKMRPGDVMVGARRREKQKPLQNQA